VLPLWDDLASADAVRGRRAIGGFTAVGDQAVAFFQQRLRPLAPLAAEQITQRIHDLDSIDFTVRERASDDLEVLGERAEGALRSAAVQSLSAEVRRRATLLLGALRGPGMSLEELRVRRALQALRYIGSPQAVRLARTIEAQSARP
jgi:hypothetical protein